MKFKINDATWEIIELSQKEMRETFEKHYDKPAETGRYFGLTYTDDNKIYIDKEICTDRKRQTLKHELMHCYIASYLFDSNNKQYSEEDLCNISSNAHDIINKIYLNYFKGE